MYIKFLGGFNQMSRDYHADTPLVSEMPEISLDEFLAILEARGFTPEEIELSRKLNQDG